MTQLSNIRPDFEALVQQLRSVLSGKDSWKDLLESSTGQTLIEFMSGIGTMQFFNLERSIQEVFTETASLDSSIYTIARMLGVNPKRKTSATTTGTVTIPVAFTGSVLVPQYTQFKINDTLFYNQEEIIFLAGQVSVSNISFEQGIITSRTFVSDGSNFQEYSVSKDFEANENLMIIRVAGDLYKRERRSFFPYNSSDKVFLEFTMSDGSIRIVFPNSLFGTIPPQGSDIVVTYAESSGQESNQASSGLSIKLIDVVPSSFGDLEVTGTTNTAIVGGSAKVSSDELRYTAPRLFASAERAITRNDWEVISLAFAGVSLVDVVVYGEYELNSLDNTQMNVVNVVLLQKSGAVFTAIEKTNYLNYMDSFKHYTTLIVINDPVPVPINIDIDVFYFDGIDPLPLQQTIINQIATLFEIKLESLNKTYHLSDIVDLVKNNPGVDYVILNSPTGPIILSRQQFVQIGTTSVTMVVTPR